MAKKPTWGGKRAGAGRKANPEGKAVTVVASVPEGLVDDLDVLAETEGWGRSRAITEAIRALLKRKKRA
jgi:metal-responsive CopG/Arc/MetJ family transcriptional regulator